MVNGVKASRPLLRYNRALLSVQSTFVCPYLVLRVQLKAGPRYNLL